MKKILKKIPFLNVISKAVYISITSKFRSFSSSENYWEKRYKSGGNSGDGSYSHLAEFKAKILNAFITEKEIQSVIELGCGDGNQLKYANYNKYIGFDISSDTIANCKKLFINDNTKKFKLLKELTHEKAELSLSLDVIYHLVENEVFHSHMNSLFDLSTKYVIIYSSNTNKQETFQAPHVKHRKFSLWIEKNKTNWIFIKHISNLYPLTMTNPAGSLADFYIYEKK